MKGRFEPFPDEERTVIMTALTLMLADVLFNSHIDASFKRRVTAKIIELINELAGEVDLAVDEDLRAQLMARLDQQAAEARDA